MKEGIKMIYDIETLLEASRCCDNDVCSNCPIREDCKSSNTFGFLMEAMVATLTHIKDEKNGKKGIYKLLYDYKDEEKLMYLTDAQVNFLDSFLENCTDGSMKIMNVEYFEV